MNDRQDTAMNTISLQAASNWQTIRNADEAEDNDWRTLYVEEERLMKTLGGWAFSN